jgi:hypothetical protein
LSQNAHFLVRLTGLLGEWKAIYCYYKFGEVDFLLLKEENPGCLGGFFFDPETRISYWLNWVDSY